MRATLTVTIGLAVAMLAACSERTPDAASGGRPTAREPDLAARPARPWEVASEPGLWRSTVSETGLPPTGSSLTCHGGGQVLPFEPAQAGCQPPTYSARRQGGWVRERRCRAADGSPLVVRQLFTGDLASGFSVHGLPADGPPEPVRGSGQAWYLRLGPCPDGWRVAEVRREGEAPSRPAAPASVRRPAPPSAPPPIFGSSDPLPPEIVAPPLPPVDPQPDLEAPEEPLPPPQDEKP